MNIEFKGTQGEWVVEHDEIVSEDGESICVVVFEESDDISNANAQLLASAPKLLEALLRILDLDCPLTGDPSRERLIEHWEWEHSQGNGAAEDNLFALAVIAEALGEQP